MREQRWWFLAVLVLSLVVVACGQEPTLIPVEGTAVPDTPTPGWPAEAQPLVDQAVADVALRAEVDPDKVNVVQVEQVEWPNSCLGCPREDEQCLQVITPGYRLTLEAAGQTYTYHAAEDRLILCEDGRPVDDWGPAQPLVDQAVADVALRAEVDPDKVNVVQVEQVEWPDSCLDCPREDEQCLQVITPGYRLTFEAAGETYTYHAAEDRLILCEDGRPVDDWGPAQPLVDQAVADVANRVEVEATDIEVVRVEAVEWRDSCLGCPKPDEACAQVITPGYRILIRARKQLFEYHTDTTDRIVLCQEVTEMDDPEDGKKLVDLVMADLADRLGIDQGEIGLIQVEEVMWRDSSLGCPKPGQAYLQVITPGYRIILEAQGQQYEYHTDTEAKFVLCEQDTD